VTGNWIFTEDAGHLGCDAVLTDMFYILNFVIVSCIYGTLNKTKMKNAAPENFDRS
jgi:hypothetical protein